MNSTSRAIVRRSLGLIITLVLGAGTVQATVSLNPRGMGQVLVYPYYTVNAGYNTLLSVTNTTGNGKALKVRFHEAYDGRDVLDLNVYLGPYDVWVAALIPYAANLDAPNAIGTALLSDDQSCTVPALQTITPSPGSSRSGLTFSSANYTGAKADGGPTDVRRENEGHFDIIEMGEVTNTSQGTLTAITANLAQVGITTPNNCNQVVNAWGTNGYWTTNPYADLSPPGGGLFGTVMLVDVAQGQLFTANAMAIDGFSTAAQHTAPDAAAPDLNTASATNGVLEASVVEASVSTTNGQIVTSFYRPIDAVSALFASDSVYNEFNIQSSLGAQSDWVLTFPTKRFYVDPAMISVAPQPFQYVFGTNNYGDPSRPLIPAGATSCVFGATTAIGRWGSPCSACNGSVAAACYESSVLTFNTPNSTLGSNLGISVSNGSYPTVTSEVQTNGVTSGYLIFDIGDASDIPSNESLNCSVLTSTTGQIFCGFPVIGFSATNYVNGNVTPGVLANYGGLNPHRTREACYKSGTDGSGAPCS